MRCTEWAAALLQRDDWVILDTETTGLDSSAEAIQIAIVSSRGEVLVDILVKPVGEVTAGARAVHGISDAMLANAPTYALLHEHLVTILRGRTVIAYNAQFDARILSQTAGRYSVALPEIRWECAMQKYEEFLGRRAKLPNAKHSAVADCQATLAIIQQMASAPATQQPGARRRKPSPRQRRPIELAPSPAVSWPPTNPVLSTLRDPQATQLPPTQKSSHPPIWLLILAAAIAALVLFLILSARPSSAAAACGYTAGFAALHDQIPDVVGDCADDPRSQASGDVQQTTVNGLLVWRKLDNWTAFTDGSTTWVNGPCGLESRLNTQTLRFERKQECEPAERNSSVPWGRLFGSYFTHGTYLDIYDGDSAYGVMSVRAGDTYQRIDLSFTEFSVDAANAFVTYSEAPDVLPVGPVYLYLNRNDVLTVRPAGPDQGFELCGPDADWQATGCAGA